MEVHLSADTEQKLKNLSAQSGRPADDLVEDAMAGYFQEVSELRDLLENRYNDLESGRVKPLSAEEVETHFREKSAAARRLRSE